ncbi:hypothetical protein ACM66B_001253 [Microbotryomycetes sp. NB124-2]
MSSTPMLQSLSSSSTYSTSSFGAAASQPHRRTTSGSFRIEVNQSPPSPTSSSSLASSSSSSPTSKARIRLRADVFDDASHHSSSGWATGSALKRTLSARRTLLVVVAIVCIYAWTSTATSFSSSSTTSKTNNKLDLNDSDAVPVVDRAAIDKLRLLEIHFGADEEQSDENSAPVDGVGSRGQAGLRQDKQRAQQEENDLEEHGGERDDDDNDAPPMVVDIPQFIKPDPLAPEALERVPARILDRQVCPENGGRPCSFLLAAWLGEQETKAQQHLHQLGMLAMSLNRTLVLPNVSKSRMGTCYANPFDFYYSSSSLEDLGIPTITHEDFVAWTLQRDPPPSAQVVSMMSAKSSYPQGAIEIDSASDPYLVPNKPTRNFCLRQPKTKLDFNQKSPLVIYPPEGYHKNDNSRRSFGESCVNTLKSRDVAARSSRAATVRDDDDDELLPDVYAFNYELRYPMMSPAVVTSFQTDLTTSTSATLPDFQHFEYSDLWHDLSDVIVQRLSPFIAIHWRTETLSSQNLVPCATRLVNKLVSLKRVYPEIETVYLATDYPIEDLLDDTTTTTTIPHSGTFAKAVLPQHHQAFQQFIKLFEQEFGAGRKGRGGGGQGNKLRLTTFAREQKELEGRDVSDSFKQRIIPLMPFFKPEQEDLGQDVNDDGSRTTMTQHEGGGGIEFEKGQLDVGLVDPGLYGILDKLIVTRSQVFLTGLPSSGGTGSNVGGACAKLSSFTNQMIEARERMRGLQHGGEDGGERRKEELWNTVTHWSLKGDE